MWDIDGMKIYVMESLNVSCFRSSSNGFGNSNIFLSFDLSIFTYTQSPNRIKYWIITLVMLHFASITSSDFFSTIQTRLHLISFLSCFSLFCSILQSFSNFTRAEQIKLQNPTCNTINFADCNQERRFIEIQHLFFIFKSLEQKIKLHQAKCEVVKW